MPVLGGGAIGNARVSGLTVLQSPIRQPEPWSARSRTLQAAADGPFTPASLSPNVWIEADPATLFSDAGVTAIADGQAVAQWNDKSGNGRNLNDNGNGLTVRPIYHAASGGVGAYLQFDGVNDSLSSPSFVPGDASGQHWYAISGYINDSSIESVFAELIGGNPVSWVRTNGGNLGVTTWNNVGGATDESDGAVPSATSFVAIVTVGASAAEAFVNNTSDGSTALTGTRENNSAGLFVGANTYFNKFLAGRIYGLVQGKGALSATDRANLQSYLAALAVSSGPASYSMTASPGVFTLAGSAAGLAAQRRMAAARGSFALNGSNAGLAAQRRMVAGTGAFALAGSATSFGLNRRLIAATGTFNLSAGAAGLLRGRNLTAATGSFALNGSATGLRLARRLAAATGAFALSGTAVTMAKGGARIIASPGVFTLLGSAALFRVNRVLVAQTGAFALTGQPVSLSKTGAPTHYSMSVTPGVFSYHGFNATLHIAALPFFIDTAPASLGLLSVAPQLTAVSLDATAAVVPLLPIVATAAVPPPQAFSKEAAIPPPVTWET